MARLGSDWVAVHDLQIGNRGSNIDHLVLGQGGVFSLNTKHLTGEVIATARSLRVNGYRSVYFPKAVAEARAVAGRLEGSLPDGVRVTPVLVVIASKVDVRVTAPDVAVLIPKQLLGWLNQQARVLSDDQVKGLEKIIRLPTTWAETRNQPQFVFKRWRRDGHDRIYVNDLEGVKVAMYDRKTKTLEVEDEVREGEVRRALTTYLKVEN